MVWCVGMPWMVKFTQHPAAVHHVPTHLSSGLAENHPAIRPAALIVTDMCRPVSRIPVCVQCRGVCRAALSTATGVMGSLWQQLFAGLLALLLFGTLQTQAQTMVNALATVADIQAKINAAPDNTAQTIIQIAGGIVRGTLPSGTTDMGSSWIKLDKRGVTLRGSTDPNNPTIFQTNITTLATDGAGSTGAPGQQGSCLAQSEGIPFLQVCPAYAAGSPYPPSDATVFPIIIDHHIHIQEHGLQPFCSPRWCRER